MSNLNTMDTETVRLYSNACNDIFRANNGSSFCNQLYKTLKLPLHNYECGVSQVDFIIKDNNLFGNKSADNSIMVKYVDEQANHIGIEEPKEHTLKSLTEALNKVSVERGIRFNYHKFQVSITNLLEKEVLINLGEGLLKVFPRKIFTIKGKSSFIPVIRHSEFQPRRVHILTDFTKNQYSADGYLPIIKTLYIGKSEYNQVSVPQITFVPVSKQNINTIKIDIVDDNFREVVLPESQTYVELVFRTKL